MDSSNGASDGAFSAREPLVGRPELVRRCTAHHKKPVLLVAPSGFGKSTFASLYSRTFENAVWLDASSKSNEEIAADAGERLGRGPVRSRTVLVVDDWSGEVFEEGLAELRSLLESYLRDGLALVVTTRQQSDADPPQISEHDWNALRDSDLVFSYNELALLAAREDFHDLGMSVDELMKRTGGIARLVALLLKPHVSAQALEAERVTTLVELLTTSQVAEKDLLYALLGFATGSFDELRRLGLVSSRAEIAALRDAIPVLGISPDFLRFDAPTLPTRDLIQIARAQDIPIATLSRFAYELAKAGRVGSGAVMMSVYDALEPNPQEVANWIKFWARALIDVGEFSLLEALERRVTPLMALDTPECIVIAAEKLCLLERESRRIRDLAISAYPLVPQFADKVRCIELRLTAALSMGSKDEIVDALALLENLDTQAHQNVFARKSGAQGAFRALDLATMAYAQVSLGETRKGEDAFLRACELYQAEKAPSYARARAAQVLVSLDGLLCARHFEKIGSVGVHDHQDVGSFSKAYLGVQLARTYLQARETQFAQAYLESAEAYFRAYDAPPFDLVYVKAFLAGDCGDHEEAKRSLLALIQLACAQGYEMYANRVRIDLARMLVRKGMPREGAFQADMARRFFASKEDELRTVLADCVIAHAYCEEHEFAKAKEIELRISNAYALDVPVAKHAFAELSAKMGEESRGEIPHSFRVPPPSMAVPKDALYLKLFGSIELSKEGHTKYSEDWGKRKALTLFSWLVISGGSDISRELIYQRLWKLMDVERARNNFYVTYAAIRRLLKELGSESCLKNKGGVCRVDPRMVFSDVAEFDHIEGRLVMLDESQNPREMLELYRRMHYLYTGPLAPGTTDDDLFRRARQMYHDKFVQGMLHGSQIALMIGDAKLAVWFAQQALNREGIREEVYQALMRAQLAANQRGGAMETYHHCRECLAQELGINPSRETVTLYNEVLTADGKHSISQ